MTSKARNIVLMGFMGTGKTAVGKRLATRLGMEFVDMDHVIEHRAGKSVSRIFAEDGEPRFREMERALAAELSAHCGLVIGCGGGVVLNPDNVRQFQRSGLVVCLTASADTIFKRTSRSRHRPLLEKEDRFQRIVDLLDKRRALYAAIPNQIDTEALSIQQVVDAIIRLHEQSAA